METLQISNIMNVKLGDGRNFEIEMGLIKSENFDNFVFNFEEALSFDYSTLDTLDANIKQFAVPYAEISYYITKRKEEVRIILDGQKLTFLINRTRNPIKIECVITNNLCNSFKNLLNYCEK